jgi:hypothetical protein
MMLTNKGRSTADTERPQMAPVASRQKQRGGRAVMAATLPVAAQD